MTRRDRTALIAFFGLAFVLSWVVWGSIIGHQQGLLGWQLGDTLAYLGVSVSAVAVTAATGGKTALKAFGRRFLVWRLPPRWYLFALLVPAFPGLLAVGLYLVLGGHHRVDAIVSLIGVLPLLLTQRLLHLLGEEAGWRGFALPRLRRGLAPVPASLVLGALWATWHIPLFLIEGSHQTYPFAGFVIMALAVTQIMTWQFDRTRQSLPLAALFHASMNASWAALNLLWGDGALFWLATTVIGLTGVLFAVLQARAGRVKRDDPTASITVARDADVAVG